MVTFGPQFENDEGVLSLEDRGDSVVDVFFRPSEARLRAARRQNDPNARVRLLRFDAERQVTTVFPVNTMPTSPFFLEPKYEAIVSLELQEGNSFYFDGSAEEFSGSATPKTVDDIISYLSEAMPSGFLKDPNFGLGVDRTLKFIIDAVAKVDGVDQLRLTDKRSLDVGLSDDGRTYEMGYALFDALRRNANSFDEKARRASRKKKKLAAYSNLLTRLDDGRFPLMLAERAPDDVADAIGPAFIDENLSERDREAVVKLAGASVRTSFSSQRDDLIKLHEAIELASLEELIAHMQAKIASNANEPHWQKLFAANPFILDMAFNVPVLMLQGQAHVGGKTLAGSGEKIADFLFANALTDSIAVLEIKKPSMSLLASKPYRAGVYPPSSELAGAVTQALDQIEKLHSDIYRVQSINRPRSLASYGIKGVVVAGTIPADADRKRCFELFRSALSGVSVITFDELLGKLTSLHALLSGTATRSDA